MSGKIKKHIACLGFAANPPHLGHLWMAKRALKESEINEVWLVPCGSHSFAKTLFPKRHRLRMAKFLGTSRIRVSAVELRRKGISYTIDTVRTLKKRYPMYTFSWIIGSDIIVSKSYKRWKNWKTLSRLIPFWVIRRPGYPLPKRKLDPCFKVLRGKNPYRVSSTLIRERMRESHSLAGLVPKNVDAYIKRNRLKF